MAQNAPDALPALSARSIQRRWNALRTNAFGQGQDLGVDERDGRLHARAERGRARLVGLVARVAAVFGRAQGSEGAVTGLTRLPLAPHCLRLRQLNASIVANPIST